MLVTFILENKNFKRAWKFLLKTLLTMVCYWLQFLNPWCARTKHIFLFLYKSLQFFLQVGLLVYIICLIQIFALAVWISYSHVVASCFFYFSSISSCWDPVQGSPWSISYRSTLQNHNGHHKVSLPPKVS